MAVAKQVADMCLPTERGVEYHQSRGSLEARELAAQADIIRPCLLASLPVEHCGPPASPSVSPERSANFAPLHMTRSGRPRQTRRGQK